MADRGSSEKHGLALFCAFMVSWALIRMACQKPAASVADEPYPFATRSSRRYSPAGVIPTADGGPVMTPPEPAFKRDAVSLLSQPSAGGAPPAMMDETAASAAGGGENPASASAASPRPALNGGPGWEMGPGSGGARPTASVMASAAGPSPSAATALRPGAPPAPRPGVASAVTPGPAGAGASVAPAAAAAAGAPNAAAGAPAAGAADPLAAAAAAAPKPANPGPQAPAATDSAAAAGGGGGGGAGGGGGGGGGGAGGGDAGGGGGGGLSGGPTAQKPTGSAGPPAGGASAAGAAGAAGAADAGSGGAGGGAGGGGGGGAGGDQAQIADVKPTLSEPQLDSAKPTGEAFALHPHEPRSVPIVVDTKTGAVKFMAKMAIDADGAGGFGARDKTNINDGKTGDDTKAHHANGKPLNPMVIPFIVVPPDIGHGIRMNDYAAVTYGGRTTMAVVGDQGPKGVVGEASPAVARPLGIPSDMNKGGVGNGVTYVILPGSGGRAVPDTAAAIDAAARAAFAQKGIPIR
ncbi:MAG TPA: glycoside hydrolase family 75 protein [Elusimicrobiota bacterium]|nr:glycoside hydrolase family 75 protein [Elusimicrobiota bacterium]